MLKSEDVLNLANELYSRRKRAKKQQCDGIQSDQVKALCDALCEAVNEELNSRFVSKDFSNS